MLIIALGIGIAFISEKTKRLHQSETASTSPKNDSIIFDSAVNNGFANANHDSITQLLYNRFYSSYTALNDPVEISNYYKYYKNNKYNEVIKAEKSDYAVLGAYSRQELLNNYMFLYKGLSYLSTNEVKKAIKNFNVILNNDNVQDRLYYTAEWYCVLSYIKSNNINKARDLLNTMQQSNSPFKQSAVQLLKLLQ